MRLQTGSRTPIDGGLNHLWAGLKHDDSEPCISCSQDLSIDNDTNPAAFASDGGSALQRSHWTRHSFLCFGGFSGHDLREIQAPSAWTPRVVGPLPTLAALAALAACSLAEFGAEATSPVSRFTVRRSVTVPRQELLMECLSAG